MNFYENSAYGKWCEKVYGKDLKQSGMVTYDELQLMYEHIDLKKNSHILDIGCGIGRMTEEICEHYRAFALGIDVDKTMIASAKEHYCNRKDISFEIMDGSSLAFGDSKYDLICMLDTIYFNNTSEELNRFLDRCYDTLSPDGKIAIFSSNVPSNALNIEPLDYHDGICKWASKHCVKKLSVSLSSKYRNFWQRSFESCLELKDIMKTEIPEQFEKLLIKSSVFSDLSRNNPSSMRRWLDIITR